MKKYVLNLTITPGAALGRMGSAFSVFLLVLLAVFPAHARLKIQPVFVDHARPPAMTGGGSLQEIFKVAAERWEAAAGTRRRQIDLLTVATHEIGHLLGLDEAYAGYRKICDSPSCAIDITAPRPFAGLTIYVIDGPHLTNRWVDAGDPLQGDPLMVPDPTPGVRQLISSIDALVIAEFSSFSSPNLNVQVAPPF